LQHTTVLQPIKLAYAMKLAIIHPWELSVGEAKALQPQLADNVVDQTTFDPTDLRTVAGVDVSFRQGVARAAVVVLGFPGLEPVDYALGKAPASFPYVPGLLTFREGPSVLDALSKLGTWPDLFIFDGHGIAHPCRIGLAAHMGVILDHPSIGCAKSRLVGHHTEPGNTVGDWTPLWDQDEMIGGVLRNRASVKPVYVSVGHRVDLTTAIGLVRQCTRGYRLPETTRYAHKVAGGARLDIGEQQQPLF
jgi:deoxyribonuclease V